MEYDKIDGYQITPKNNLKFTDAINVKSMILINPSLIEKMVDIKARIRFNHQINLLAIIYEDDDTTGEGLRLAHTEAEKFRMEIINKYKKYISDEKLELLENKLAILEDELNLRMQYLLAANEELQREGKSRQKYLLFLGKFNNKNNYKYQDMIEISQFIVILLLFFIVITLLYK